MTTIHAPTEAVRRFAEMPGYRLVVVGDRKTPAGWHCDKVDFLCACGGSGPSFALEPRLSFNSYARKNLGYLHAIRNNAEAVVDIDDDNVPHPWWGFPSFEGVFGVSPSDLGFVNIYRSYTDALIWPRGFPLDRIRAARDPVVVSPAPAIVGVWQGLVDDEPDVDAIYRLVIGKPCTFADGAPVVLAAGSLCPFNSQNTLFSRDAFPLLYLPSSVSMRFADILRGLVAQPILWRMGRALGFTRATARQLRNPHDYLDDFRLEVECYLRVYDVVETVDGAVRACVSAADNLVRAYEALSRAKIVGQSELDLLHLWLKDLGI